MIQQSEDRMHYVTYESMPPLFLFPTGSKNGESIIKIKFTYNVVRICNDNFSTENFDSIFNLNFKESNAFSQCLKFWDKMGVLFTDFKPIIKYIHYFCFGLLGRTFVRPKCKAKGDLKSQILINLGG